MGTKRYHSPEICQSSSPVVYPFSGRLDIQQSNTVMDKLMSPLGYKVELSDKETIAVKIDQLLTAMNTYTDFEMCQLSDTTQYNPSDISCWVENLLSELGPPLLPSQVDFMNPNHSSLVDFSSGTHRIYNEDSEYDIVAMPGYGDVPVLEVTGVNKRKKILVTESCLAAPVMIEPTRPFVVDAQEAGVKIVHTLLACAQAIQEENLKLADLLVKHIGVLGVSQTGAMRKVATYFAHALARKIYKIYPRDLSDTTYLDMLHMHFYESCPYVKFAHFTANQALLEAFAGVSQVHVIDFSLKQGMQWPALMQALALRPGGPPTFKLTGIAPSQLHVDVLQQVGCRLEQLGSSLGMKFEFCGVVAKSLAAMDASTVNISEGETVAVNSIFELHRVLAQQGAIEKVLNWIKLVNPKIVTIAEQESNHNGTVFTERFTEALHYYSSMFDSLDATTVTQMNEAQDLVMSDVYLSQQICNIISCEGPERVERHEKLIQWRARMCVAGFEQIHLGYDSFKQAMMVLSLFTGDCGYVVHEDDGCLMLGWQNRPLVATSAWQLGASVA